MKRPILYVLIAGCALALAAGAAMQPNLEDALSAQRRLAAERPSDAAVANDLGNLLRLAGELEEAETAYRRSIEIEPARAAAHFNLAVLLQQRGKLGDALTELRRTVELEPTHAWAHYTMGMVHEEKGNESRAVEAYARAFHLDPNLAFERVNPHIIENRLLTPALIRSYQMVTDDTQAPNRYEDPVRIAALLAPAPVFSDQQPMEERVVEVEGEIDTPLDRRAVAASVGVDPEDLPSSRVLSEGDLDRRRSLGQVSNSTGGRPSTRGSLRGGARTYSLGSSSGSGREEPQGTRYRPSTSTSRSTGGGFSVPGGRPSSTVRPSSPVQRPSAAGGNNGSGTRFRPGVGSTGSLGIDIAPGLGDSARSGRAG